MNCEVDCRKGGQLTLKIAFESKDDTTAGFLNRGWFGLNDASENQIHQLSTSTQHIYTFYDASK